MHILETLSFKENKSFENDHSPNMNMIPLDLVQHTIYVSKPVLGHLILIHPLLLELL